MHQTQLHLSGPRHNGTEVIARIRTSNDKDFGYNAKTGTYQNLTENGVIDPAKVVRVGLRNAGSIAELVLSTEVVITDFHDEKDRKAATIII
nr:TCP-1/cpn60 chaperonin family protein [uncultured Methanoregula sp.]